MEDIDASNSQTPFGAIQQPMKVDYRGSFALNVGNDVRVLTSSLETVRGAVIVSNAISKSEGGIDHSVQVSESDTGLTLATFLSKSDEQGPYIFSYLPHSNKLIVAGEHNIKLLRSTPQDSFLLGSAVLNDLQPQAGATKDAAQVAIEVSVSEARQLLQSLEQIGYDVSSSEGVDDKNIVVYNCRQFTYSYDLDGNGIVEYLTPEAVTVTASSVSKATPEKFIEKGEVYCWTQNEPFSWYCVDFGENISVIPSHYTLRYGSSGDSCCPRNWMLQGSNEPNANEEGEVDSPTWTTLRVHEDDHSISGSHSYCTFPITDCLKAYRYFRVIQTGPNCYDAFGESEDKWSNVLVASGFELYGVLKEKTAVQEHIVESMKSLILHLKKGIQNFEESEPSNKRNHWSTIAFQMPYLKMKAAFLALVPQIAEYVGFSVAHGILESIKVYGQSALNDTEGFTDLAKQKSSKETPAASASAPKTNMNCEYNRLESFKDWPHSSSFFAKPSSLAVSGFYHDPKPITASTSSTEVRFDGCICFSCQVSLDTWEEFDDPWDAHFTHSPTCRFIQGKPTANVPLSVTLASLPSKKHGTDNQKIIDISSLQGVDAVVTASSTEIVVWDASLSLCQAHLFTPKSQVNRENLGDQQLVKVAMLPLIKLAAPANSLSKEKWAKWVCADIQVEQTEAGLYPGAKGTVLEVLSEDEVKVLVFGLHEEMLFPIKHLKMVKPKPNQRVKIVQGEWKGHTGVLVSHQKSSGLVKLDDVKEVKVIDINHIASTAGEDDALATRDVAAFAILAIFSSNEGQSTLALFEYNKGKAKLVQSVASDRGRIIKTTYVASIKTFFALSKLADGSSAPFSISAYSYDPETCQLTFTRTLPIGVAEDEILSLTSATTSSGDILAAMSTKGSIYIVDAARLDLISETPGKLESKLVHFVYVSDQELLVALDSTGNMHRFSLHPADASPSDKNVTLGDITLSNVVSLNKLDLEPLSFACYPPVDVKQLAIHEKNGASTKVKWHVPSMQPTKSKTLSFEIEFPKVQIVDRLVLSLGLSSATFEDSIFKYLVSISYLNPDVGANAEQIGTWTTALSNHDVLPLVRSDLSASENDATETRDDVATDDEPQSASINVHFTTRRMRLELRYVVDETALRASHGHSSGTSAPKSPTLQGMSLSLYGVKSNTKDALARREKRLALADALDFHARLIETCQDAATRGELRSACLELLFTIYQSKGEIGSLQKHIRCDAFLKNCVILASSSTARAAARLLLYLAQLSPPFSEQLFEASLDAIPFAADCGSSSTSVDQLFSIVSSFWSKSPSFGFARCVEVLRSIGRKLHANRSPFYNLLRTHYDLYGYPLENDLFVAKSLEEKEVAVVGGDELTFAISSASNNAVTDHKKKITKFTKLHRSGNWLIVDFGGPCLLTDLAISFATSLTLNNGQLTIDTWMEHESDGSRLLFSKIQLGQRRKKSDKKDTFAFHELSRICRYVKVDIKSSNPSGEVSVSVVSHGVYDFVSAATTKSEEFLPKLKSQLRAAEEKNHVLSDSFASKKRKLTTLLEEINISGDSFSNHEQEVVSAYNECMQAQAEHHKEIEKLSRLRQIELELGQSIRSPPNSPAISHAHAATDMPVPGDCKLDRWTYVAEQVCKRLLFSEKEDKNLGMATQQVQLDRKNLEELFQNYCVFGTPTLRKQIGRLMAKQLRSLKDDSDAVWPTFLSDTLKTYFSNPSVPIGPLNLFPHNEVYALLQDIMIQDEDLRGLYLDDLFHLLEKISPNLQNTGDSGLQATTAPPDLALVAWILSLLVINLARTNEDSVVHPGSKCHGCQMTPIRGVRYKCVNCVNYDLCEQCESKASTIHNKLHLFLKINKPLPLPPNPQPVAKGQRNPMESPLLPVLYTPKKSASTNGKEKKDKKSTTDDEVMLKGNVHTGVACDGCGSSIVGIRYKCVNCDDYDLCEACEGKVEHHPSHLFLRVRYPFIHPSITATPVPKALIPNQALVPMLLHKALYPTQPTEPTPTNKAVPQKSDLPLRSVFSLLISSWNQPLAATVLLLATKVLESLSRQYLPLDFLKHVFTNENFAEFLQHVAFSSDAFLRNAVLHFLETLSKPASYVKPGDLSTVLEIRSLIRQKAAALLDDPTDVAANFVLETLLIASRKSDVEELQREEADTERQKSLDEVSKGTEWRSKSAPAVVFHGLEIPETGPDFALDAATSRQLLSFLQSSVLTSIATARSWCTVFRLLQLAEPLPTAESEAVIEVLNAALLATEDLQLLLQDDLTQLLQFLLKERPLALLGRLLDVLVESFPHAKMEDHPLLYLTLVATLRANLVETGPFRIAALSSLLEHVASALPEIKSDPHSKEQAKKDKLLLQDVTELLNAIAVRFDLKKREELLDFERNNQENFALTQIIKWIGAEAAETPTNNTASGNSIVPSASVAAFSAATRTLKDELLTTIDILSASNEGAKYLIDLCLQALKEKPANDIAQLCFKLTRNEELAYHFAIELKGCKFLFKQLSNSPSSTSSMIPISNAILSNIVAKSSQIGLDQKPKRVEKAAGPKSSTLENLNPVCKILESNNLLSRLIRESGSSNSSSCVWTHQFKKSPVSGSANTPSTSLSPSVNSEAASASQAPLNLTSSTNTLTSSTSSTGENNASSSSTSSAGATSNEFAITIVIPNDVILREILIHAMQNYHIGSGSSSFPSHVTVETGMALDRLLPCGRLTCAPNKSQPNPQRCYTSSFKFTLPTLEVVQVVRLRLACPDKSPYIALSRIQLRGHLLGNTGEYNEPTFATELPVETTLELLAHLLKFSQVQQFFAQKSSAMAIALSLLSLLNSDAQAHAQDILWYLAKNNTELSYVLLDKVLVEGQSTHHAALAGRLCSIEDADTDKRLNRLRDFVFGQLEGHTSVTSFSSHLTPFLNALSQAIHSQRRAKVQVNAREMLLLLQTASHSLEGSLLEESSLKLMASLVQSDPQNYQMLLDQVKTRLNGQDAGDASAFRVLGILASCSPASAERLLTSNIPTELLQRIQDILNANADSAAVSSTSQRILEISLPFFANVACQNLIKDWLGGNAMDALFSLCSRPGFSSKALYSALHVIKSCCNLNQKNQERIAVHLVRQVTSGRLELSDFMLQVMVELFSFEERTALCLHHDGKGEDPLAPGVIEFPTKKGLHLDPEYCDSHIELDENLLTVTCSTTTKWCTVLGSEGYTSGYHKWDVVIEKCTSTCNIMIGVCEKSQNLAYYVGQDTSTNGWAYYGCNGYLYHGGGSKPYGSKLKQGDVLTVELDMDSGTVTFSKNGSSFGIAYTNVEDKEIYPAVSLYDIGDSVSFVDTTAKKVAAVKQLQPMSNASILQNKIGLSSPLRFQRVDPLFSLPAHTNIDELKNKLIGPENRDKRDIKFSLRGVLLEPATEAQDTAEINNTVTLQQLAASFSQNEIVDLKYSMESYAATAEKKAPSVSFMATPTSLDASIPPVLKIFASNSGLEPLVSILYAHYKKQTKVDKNEETLKKKRWLKELRCHMQIKGYSTVFIRSNHCRALLFRAMKAAKDVSDDSSLPKSVLENPQEPLYAALFQLFSQCNTIPVDSSLVMKEALSSGSLNLLLNRLSALCSVEHRNSKVFSTEKKKSKEEAIKKSSEQIRPEYWAKGTGFGTSADDKSPSTWTHNDYTKQQEQKSQQIEVLYQGINAYLSLKGPLPDGLVEVLMESCLIPAIEGYLRNDSILEMVRFKNLHISVLQLVRSIASHPQLVQLLVQKSSLEKMMDQLNSVAQVILRSLSQNKTKLDVSKDKILIKSPGDSNVGTGQQPAQPSVNLLKKTPSIRPTSSKGDGEDSEEAALAKEIVQTANFAREKIEEFKSADLQKSQEAGDVATPVANPGKEEVSNSNDDPVFEKYKAALQPLQFEEVSMMKKGAYVHHYRSRIEKDDTNVANEKEKVKRLIQEVGSMSTSLPLYAQSSIFVRVDSTRIDVMEALITGPTGTPYGNGCFQFDIYCPPEYPKVPPQVNLQTTGGGSVRFNPNLYNCGKVCLSLLGTWKGAENEKWNAKTSTLLQVFISIQSLILVEEPYFNEPGYETEIGKPNGIQRSREYNEVIRIATMKWAMLEQIKRPSPGFEEVIRLHFKIKRAEILKQCHDWVKEGGTSKTVGHYEKIRKIYDELQKELQKLDPDVPLELPEDVTEAEKKEKAEKEAKRKALVSQLQEFLSGYPQSVYVQALDVNNDKLDAAVNWLLERSEKGDFSK